MNAAIDDGQIEVFFIKYDFVSYPDQDAILRRAAECGIGTMVFKTNAGNRQGEIKDLEAGGLSFPQATVRWALTNSYVASVAVSMSNFDTIRQYSTAASTTLTTAEVSMLRRYADEMYDKYCRFCGECEASCPHGVAVADINRFAMYFSGYGREKRPCGAITPCLNSARLRRAMTARVRVMLRAHSVGRYGLSSSRRNRQLSFREA